MKSIGRAAVAQWTTRRTRNGQTRVQIRGSTFLILHIILTTFSAAQCRARRTTGALYL